MFVRKERELQIIAGLPANAVEAYIKGKRIKAAVTLQSVWRGKIQRRNYFKIKKMSMRVSSYFLFIFIFISLKF